MRRRFLLGFTASALLAAACPEERPDEADCERACAIAARCGALPSTLGGEPGDDLVEATASCEARCTASDPGKEVDDALDCLLADADADLCAVDACLDAVECLRDSLPAAALASPEVTFRLVDGEFWLLLFQPELCAEITDDDTSIGPEERAEFCAGTDDPCRGEGATLAQSRRLPLCTGESCDPDLDGACDPRLCSLDIPPSSDCALYGIDTVQFGYYDEREVLHLDTAIYSCADAGKGQVVPDITSEVIYPVALFTGKTSVRLLDLFDAQESPEGRPYCWISHPGVPGETGWFIRGGSNLIPVPSPSSALLFDNISDDSDFPRGCGCPTDTLVGCEHLENKNCDNGLDDDGDGVLDGDDPGCAP